MMHALHARRQCYPASLTSDRYVRMMIVPYIGPLSHYITDAMVSYVITAIAHDPPLQGDVERSVLSSML